MTTQETTANDDRFLSPAHRAQHALAKELEERLHAVIRDVAKRTEDAMESYSDFEGVDMEGDSFLESTYWQAAFIIGEAALNESNGTQQMAVKKWRRALQDMMDLVPDERIAGYRVAEAKNA